MYDMLDHSPSPHRPLMSGEPDWVLLGQYLRGACTAEEVAVVERWEAASQGNARTLELLRRVWHEAAVDEDEGWSALQARIAADARAVKVQPLRVLAQGTERKRRVWRRWAGIVTAAAAALTLTVGPIALRRVGVEPASRPGREYVTTRGQRAELVLVDGTRAWLNADSRLRLLPGYGSNARDVALEGEAYFVVEHDAKRPFRVHTSGAVSEDLGTEFNVRAYADDADERVLVAVGRVAVRRNGSSTQADSGVTLGRGQMGRLDRAGRLAVIDRADLAATLAWREDRLEFEERPLTDVVREFERWYDLHITLDDSILARVPVTATLIGQTADQALGALATTLNVRYTRSGREVRFSAGPP